MEIPHAKLLTLSLLFRIFLAELRRGLTWHIHAALGNAWGG
jgi:hypothetical protein